MYATRYEISKNGKTSMPQPSPKFVAKSTVPITVAIYRYQDGIFLYSLLFTWVTSLPFFVSLMILLIVPNMKIIGILTTSKAIGIIII